MSARKQKGMNMKNKQPTFLMEIREAEFYEGTIATETPVMRQNGEEEILVMHPTNRNELILKTSLFSRIMTIVNK